MSVKEWSGYSQWGRLAAGDTGSSRESRKGRGARRRFRELGDDDLRDERTGPLRCPAQLEDARPSRRLDDDRA